MPPAPAPGTQVRYLDLNPAVQATGLTIDQSNQTNYGYLRITVNGKQIRIEFHPVSNTGAPPNIDRVVVMDLASHTVVP